MAQTVGPHTNDTAQIAQTVSSNTSGTAQVAQTFGFRFKWHGTGGTDTWRNTSGTAQLAQTDGTYNGAHYS